MNLFELGVEVRYSVSYKEFGRLKLHDWKNGMLRHLHDMNITAASF
jgi:hypothetical protein